MAWADKLIELRFNWAAYLAWNDFFTPAWFYLVPVTVFALLRLALAEAWVQGLLAVNLACVGFMLLVYWRCARLMGVPPWAITVGLLSLAASADLMLWPHYMLSDTVYAALVMGAVWFTLNSILKNRANGGWFWLGLVAWATSAGLSRPAAPAFIATLLATPVLIWLANRWCRSGTTLLIFSATAAVLMTMGYAVAITEFPNWWPALSNSRGFQRVVDHVREGGVIHHRPETYIGSPEGFFGILGLYGLRLVSFFSPYAAGFSSAHLALNLLQGAVLALGVAGCIWGFSGLTAGQRATVLFLMAVTGFTATYHSAILIDYDWRYRFPVVLPLTLIATMGFGAAWRRHPPTAATPAAPQPPAPADKESV